MTKIFVTGGSGYIGSVVVRRLLEKGYQVTVFDNVERGHRTNLAKLQMWGPVQFIEGDLRKAEEIRVAMMSVQPNAVIHFAAYALVGESMSDPMMYFTNNVKGGINLLEAMAACGCDRIIFSSSCATYGVPPALPIEEDMLQSPTNPYGQSKLMFEQICRWAQTTGNFTSFSSPLPDSNTPRLKNSNTPELSTQTLSDSNTPRLQNSNTPRLQDSNIRPRRLRPTFLRYFNAAGAVDPMVEDHEPETHIIPNVLKVALGQKPFVQVFGDDYPTPDGTCIRDYVHLEDLASAHILALETGAEGAFNLGTGKGISVKEIIDACRRVTGHPIPVKMCPRRPGDPPALYASGRKAREVLGWCPSYSDVDTIVRDAWAAHQRWPRGYGD